MTAARAEFGAGQLDFPTLRSEHLGYRLTYSPRPHDARVRLERGERHSFQTDLWIAVGHFVECEHFVGNAQQLPIAQRICEPRLRLGAQDEIARREEEP